MPPRTEPPFRADSVGILPRPASLPRAREEHRAGRTDAAAPKAVVETGAGLRGRVR